MSMTKMEKKAKEFIINKLSREGYPTYANLFKNFDLNLTSDESVIGFMEPAKGRIVLNWNLRVEQMSVVIRHEILHQFLKHEERLVKRVAKKWNIDPENIDDLTLQKIKRFIYKDKTFNIAADYEISNRAYTDEDKDTIRHLDLNGKILSGLVTEDDHPDWVTWTLEEMYDALTENDPTDQPPEDDDDQNDGDQDDGNSDDSGSDSGSGNSGDSDSDSDEGDSESSGSSSGQKSNSSGKSKKRKSKQNSRNSQDSGDSNDSEDTEEGDGEVESDDSSNEPPTIIYGTFDGTNFYDDNGNIIIPN